MAFLIKLQTNNSEDNKLDKNLTDIDTLSGVLRDGSSIIDPVILVDADLSDLIACNYMTIESFGRSYFVRNITSVRAGLVELRAHVDVLSSFADELAECTGIVRKNEMNYNTYLDDGTFHAYANPIIEVKKFSGGFPLLERDFVLIVAGGAAVPYTPGTNPNAQGSSTHTSSSGEEHGGSGGTFDETDP